MKPKGLFILDRYAYDVIYGPDERDDVRHEGDGAKAGMMGSFSAGRLAKEYQTWQT